MTSRRTFVTASAAALAGAPLFVSRSTAAQAPDPVEHELQRQLDTALELLRERPGEGMRRVATVFRLAAARARANEQALNRGLRRHIAQHRFDIAAAPLRPDYLEGVAKRLGIPTLPLSSPNMQGRLEGLDMMSRLGVVGCMTQVADWLEEQSRTLETWLAANRLVSARRYDPAMCDILGRQRDLAEDFVIIACGGTGASNAMGWWIYPILASQCAFWTAFLMTTVAQQHVYGCR